MSAQKPTVVLTKKASRAAAKEADKKTKVIRKMYRVLGIKETSNPDVLNVPDTVLDAMGIRQEQAPPSAVQQAGAAGTTLSSVAEPSGYGVRARLVGQGLGRSMKSVVSEIVD